MTDSLGIVFRNGIHQSKVRLAMIVLAVFPGVQGGGEIEAAMERPCSS